MSNDVRIINVGPEEQQAAAFQALAVLPKRENALTTAIATPESNQAKMEAWYEECEQQGGVQFVVNFIETYTADQGGAMRSWKEPLPGFEYVELQLHSTGAVQVMVKRINRPVVTVLDNHDPLHKIAVPGEWLVALHEKDRLIRAQEAEKAAVAKRRENQTLAQQILADV